MSVLLQYVVRRSKRVFQQQQQLSRTNTTNVSVVCAVAKTSLRSLSSNTTNTGNGSGRSNFDRDVLLPASRGELGSGGGGGGMTIPKLAARRNKANLHDGPSAFGSNGNGYGDFFGDGDGDGGGGPFSYGGASSSSLSSSLSTMNYGNSHNDDGVDVDPSLPLASNSRHIATMNMISNAYEHQSTYTRRYNDNDDDDDTDPTFVLLNPDVTTSPSSSSSMVSDRHVEDELKYITKVMFDAVRDVAELAIMEASEQQTKSSSSSSNAAITEQDKVVMEQNARRKEAILQKLQNTEYRMLNYTSAGNDRDKYTTNGIRNSLLPYLDTNLMHGVKYDGSPSMSPSTKCHTNPYLPHDKYFLDTNATGSHPSQQSMLTSGETDPSVQYDDDIDEIDDYNDDGSIQQFDPKNNVELQTIQRHVIMATAKVLELDMDFGYWQEMDYDYLLGFDNHSNTKAETEVDEAAKEEMETKEALTQILKEAEQEADAEENDDEELTALVGDKDSSGTKNGSGGGRGNDDEDDEEEEPPLSPQDQAAEDFVAWFCNKNDIFEYEHDPSLMDATEIKNLSPMVRKQLQEKNINLNDTIDPNSIGDTRDAMYENHPNMLELCSGSDEYIYAEATHAHQRRQPKPTFRANVKQPDEMFLNQFRRFVYVNNIPPIYLEGNDSKIHPPKLVDINNPVDRTFFQRNVANMMNINDMDQIFPASTTSAYIGYKDTIGLATTLLNGPNYDVVRTMEESIPPPYFQVLTPDLISHKFVVTSKETKPDVEKCMVVLSNLDVSGGIRYTGASLAKALFSSSSKSTNGNKSSSSMVVDIGDVAYGNVTADDIQFVNTTTAIVRFASPEQAASVLDSDTIHTRLRRLNSRIPIDMSDDPNDSGWNGMNQRIEVFRARRELVHRGWDTKKGQYRGTDEILKFNRRLIVDGDMPTKEFYISHAAVVMLTGVDPTIVDKRDISDFVQPYCTLQRDIEGSIQWVECNHAEHRTDRVYVGFDVVGDAETFVKAIGGTTNAFYRKFDAQHSPINVKLLHDRQPPNYAAAPLQRRPDRPIDVLLKEMNDWEQYVEVTDIEFLEKHGISKHVLDEALRAIRYNNESFGTFDSTVRTETLEPSTHLTPGQQYRDLVQLYIKTLKACVATPENPGEIFTLLQYPDEEPDFEYFEYETKRLERIKKVRLGSN